MKNANTQNLSSLVSTPRLSALALVLVCACQVARVSALPPGIECDIRRMHHSCMMGCLSCWSTYGSEVYDIAACCRQCRLTNARLVDNGPTYCSTNHVRDSWLKRMG